MDRFEWYAHWRSVRLSREKTVIGVAQINNVLREIYEFYLSPNEYAKFRLIGKYKGRVSQRLIDEEANLTIKGKKQGKETFKALVYSENPLLKSITKDQYYGSHYPIPLLDPILDSVGWKQTSSSGPTGHQT